MFISRYDNKVDKKGRVSVPAAWRAVDSLRDPNCVAVFPSPNYGAIEGWSSALMQQFSRSIGKLNPFSPQRNVFATSLLTNSVILSFDENGRILLPENIRAHAGSGDMATFAGLGESFQIWSPERFEVHQREAMAQAQAVAADFELIDPDFSGGEGA